MLIHSQKHLKRSTISPVHTVFIVLLLSGLLFGQTAYAGAVNGKAFQNWTTRCDNKNEAKIERCYIFQNLVLREGGQRVLHVAVGYIPDLDDPVALVTLPLGISLPPGASIQVDDNEALRFQIERCETNGCRAGISLDDEMLQQLQKGLEAQIIFHDGARRPISVPLSLKGFTAGLKSLK